MESRYTKIHLKFKLNGTSYQYSELKEVAYDLIKEGKSYEKSIGNFLTYWLDNKPTLEIKTSGSTGTPKTIILQKEYMVNSALATAEYFGLKPENTALLCLSADYIAGKMMLVRAMVLGLEIDCVEPSSSPLDNALKNYDFCAMVPLQVEHAIKQIKDINTLIVGGAAISSPLKSKLQKVSCAVFETYGMTETITHVAVKTIKFSDVRSSAVETSLGTPSVANSTNFKALPNVTFSIDERTCLVIDAPKVSNEVIVTNDIVNLISDTEFEWLGRYDNVINSGGVKLVPEQIEGKLAPNITNRFFVAGLEDEVLGQKLVLIVEGSSNTASILEKIKQNDTLERFEIPKAIFSLPQFVITSNGKIRRTETLKLLNEVARATLGHVRACSWQP